jgi:hypothetical protein
MSFKKLTAFGFSEHKFLGTKKFEDEKEQPNKKDQTELADFFH